MPAQSEITNYSSMLYWWPKVKDLPIPQPKTVIVPVDVLALASFWDQDIEPLKPFIPKLEAAAAEIGHPLFLRTDILSNKHDWENSCYVEQEQDLLDHVWNLIDMNFSIFGPAPSALVFRQYIPLASRFTAFSGKMPVAPERRYFVRDGVVQCHHPYQPPDSIWGASTPDWCDLLDEMNKITAIDREWLSICAVAVSTVLKGYWSVDFALAADGRWLLIDCAEGEKSYHWSSCRYAGIDKATDL